MQDLYTTIEQTALAFVASIGKEDHETYLAPSFDRNYGPLQQQLPEDIALAELDNPTYNTHYGLDLTKFSIDSSKRLLDSSIDPKKCKAWLWYQQELKDAGESVGSRYERIVMEIVWLLDFTEDGKKVTGCRQYLDTMAVDAFFPEPVEAPPQSGQDNNTHDAVAALLAVDGEEKGVEDFLKGLTVTQS